MIDAYQILEKVREKRPLIHHITNWVTIYECAQVTRSVGALPVMAHAPEEVTQMAGMSSALVLNIGTLTEGLVDAMILAGDAANRKKIPVILDAVGVGSTDMRTAAAKTLMTDIDIDILKGNAGEVSTLAGVEAEVLGVESIRSGDPIRVSQSLAKEAKCTVVITGGVDTISDEKVTYRVNNGHEMMGHVVGTGCMATSVIASFAAVERDYAKAAAAAMACFGIAGELAAKKADGPASFKEALLDALYTLDKKTVTKRARIE